ncbi:unnamed protein product [Sphagnum balticum]
MLDNRSDIFRLSGDGRMSHVPVRFISGVRPRGSPPEVLASVAGFSGVVTWLGDLLEGNISAIDTPVYEDIEEVSSVVATMSSSLDVPLWRSSGVLWQDADRLVSQAWHEAFVPVEEEEVPQRTPISNPVGSPMVVVNQVGQPRMALPTFVSFPASHAYREGGLGLVWDTCLQQLVEPNVDERERVMVTRSQVTG